MRPQAHSKRIENKWERDVMKMLIDLFSTDYGLMSLAVIVIILIMAVYFTRMFMGLMDESQK